MYDTVLIPTDGTTAALRAAEHGARLATCHEATVHVLSVVDMTSSSGFGTEVVGSDPIESAVEDSHRSVSETAAVVRESGIDPTEAVERGVPAETIVQYARQIGADIAVMGTQGRSGVRRYLEGSVTEAVVRSAPIPILTLSHGGDSASTAE